MLAATLAYWFGRRKTRHEKQAEILVEMRRMFLDLSEQFEVFSAPLDSGTTDLEHIRTMTPDVIKMVNYFRTHDVYLDTQTAQQVRWIVGGFYMHFQHMREALGAAAAESTSGGQQEDAAAREMEKWRVLELPQLLQDLEEVIRELVGTRENLLDLLRDILPVFNRRG